MKAKAAVRSGEKFHPSNAVRAGRKYPSAAPGVPVFLQDCLAAFHGGEHHVRAVIRVGLVGDQSQAVFAALKQAQSTLERLEERLGFYGKTERIRRLIKDGLGKDGKKSLKETVLKIESIL